MKIPTTLLITALVFSAWSCKPKDSAPAASGEPAATTPAAPVTEPAPEDSPEPAPPPAPTPPPVTPGKLDVGNEVSLDAVKAATWIQGEAPESFEPGHVYVFEAWATWCGPCIRVIPHMNELHKKYHDKGLHVYGMNVFEDGLEKVTNFVNKKGEEMSYPVAYTGKGSPFDKQWMKAAGVRGIPHSFIVIDGILVMRTHPASITDDLIEKLLKGGKEAAQALNEANLGSNSQNNMRETVTKFRQALIKDDIAAMESIAAELEKEDPENLFLAQMKIDIMLAKKDWAQIEAALVESPSTPTEAAAVNMIGSRLGLSEKHSSGAPAELLAKAAQTLATKIGKNPHSSPMEWIALSGLQFKTNNTEAAKASARSAIEASQKSTRGQGMPTAVFEKFSAEVEAGRLPTTQDFSQWMQEAMQKRPAPATPEQ